MSFPLLAVARACAVTTLTVGFAAPAAAQTTGGVLSGVLRSELSRTPIAGAIVEIPSLGLRTVSDSLGTLHIRRVAAGHRQVDLRALGFQSMTLLIVVANDSTSLIEVLLRAVPLPTLDVESGLRRGDERMRGFH